VSYDDIQFTKASHVLKGMGAGNLEKTPNAIEELKKKGMCRRHKLRLIPWVLLSLFTTSFRENGNPRSFLCPWTPASA